MENEYGVVLTGGGTKGAYEVGALKALKKLKLNVTCVVGASIGAINAALAVQGDMDTIDEIYSTIELKDVISIKEKLDTNKNIFSAANLARLIKDYYVQKGFENTPLKEMMEKKLDIEKVYNSDIDLGIITYSFETGKPLIAFKNDIPKEKLYDYLLASSCFPIYKSQVIDGVKYSDGGFYDNMPVNMLIAKGYKNIIVIDISGIGMRKRRSSKDVYIKIVKNSMDLGGTFDFNKVQMKNNITLGYLDTLRAFNKLTGHKFFFNKNEFNKLQEEFNLDVINGLEKAAKIYGMEYYKMYTKEEFLEELLKRHKEAKEKYDKLKHKIRINTIVKEMKSILSMVSKGLGVWLFIDYILHGLNSDMKIVDSLFGEYITAAKAMIELDYVIKGKEEN